MGVLSTRVAALRWCGALEVLDQRRLPWEQRWVQVGSAEEAVQAIRNLAVRGAPAIGLVAAYALALEAMRKPTLEHLRACAAGLTAARPTAVNLSAAVARLMALADRCAPEERGAALLAEAQALHREDAEACETMALLGASLIPGERVAVLTHCNTGALATGGVGTALGVVRALAHQGRLAMLYAAEARPVLQGARLTAWEAREDGIPVTLVADAAAGWLLASGRVQAVVVGADRIAADGSVANKVGTYPLAVLAQRHRVPFFVVAPTTTFDPSCPSGEAIPIEVRGEEEVTNYGGVPVAPPGVPAWNPAFDVTPPELVSAIVCQRGVVRPVSRKTLSEVLR